MNADVKRSKGSFAQQVLQSLDEMPYLNLPARQGTASGHSETPAADGELPLGLLLRRVYLAVSRGLNQLLKERNVTPAQWVFLRMLWHEDGLNQKELAERVGVHPTTAVPALNILERIGYIERERSGLDKRNITVRLTPQGRALAHELLPIAMDNNRRALAGLSERDADKLMQLLLVVLRNVEGEYGAVAEEALEGRGQRLQASALGFRGE